MSEKPRNRAKSAPNQGKVSKGSANGQVVVVSITEYSVSQNTAGLTDMLYDDQQLDLDPTIILLGFGYATVLLIAIAWLAGF